MPKSNLSIVILTFNEEKNIKKCIESAMQLTNEIYILDSFSDDNTIEIAKEFDVSFLQRAWTNHADQFNWGLDNFDIKTDWVMRLDADEEITQKLAKELNTYLAIAPQNVTGILVKRQVYFLGKWIKHGGYYPTWLLRVFRNGIGRCEDLIMDEHIVVGNGETIQIHADIIDKNNKDLTFWTNKHNNYASLEMQETIKTLANEQTEKHTVKPNLSGTQINKRRWIKENMYLNLPLFVRPFMYFFYRYFIKLGFLDGKEGLIFHFLQGFWYRFLVDAKIYEYKKKLHES